MPQPVLEVIIIFLLILVNGVFAMSEIALVSSRKIRLEQMAEDGIPGAKSALELAHTPNRLLSTVQVGISLVGIFSGAVGGVTLGKYLVPVFDRIPELTPYSQAISLVIVSLTITYFSLVIGELIPKRIALNNPENVAAAVAGPMKAIAWVVGPVVALLSFSTEMGLRLIGAKKSNEPPITEEEIKVLMEQGTESGIFEETEQDIVESVFRLGDRRADSIMTPRTDMVWLDLDEPVDEILAKTIESPHNFFPVAHDSLDNVSGILLAKDLLIARMKNKDIDLKSLMTPPIFVPESTPVFKVLENFKNRGLTLVLVLDEYGGITGMITLTDILEAIVGDIPATGEEFEPLVVQRPDGSWLVDGLLHVDELKELLDMDDLPDEERIGYQTLGGLVMSQLGEIPSAGQSFEWQGFHFEVMDMDNRRVDKVLVTPPGMDASNEHTEETENTEDIEEQSED